MKKFKSVVEYFKKNMNVFIDINEILKIKMIDPRIKMKRDIPKIPYSVLSGLD